MRKMPHRVVRRGEDGALKGATIRLKTKPACCGRARRAYPMISIPWLPRTAPIRVIKLRTNRIQCSRSTSAKVASGRELARTRSHRWRNSGSATNSIKVNSSHTATIALIHHCHDPPVRRQKKTVPQVEPNDHVEAGDPGKHRCDASLPAKTPLDSLEEDDPFRRGMEITHCGQ